MSGAILKGITWGHSRGITPLLAASQRYSELHPGIEIQWKKRTLQEFADLPIESLTQHYDLLVIDHPWVGRAAATHCVLPLDQYMPASFLDDQSLNSTGYSHLSYNYDNRQWALAIDAATPAASYRADLFEKNAWELPAVWEDVLQLAVRGKVAVPGIPLDLLMNFYSFCIAAGEEPFQEGDEVVSVERGRNAIEMMKELYSYVDDVTFSSNPIAVAEMMSTTDKYWYCPFAYAYSNYSRPGYAAHLLCYANVVTCRGRTLRTTIGGTGLAVSVSCMHKDIALDFAAMVAGGEFQRTVYVQHGGQPGHRSAWLDEDANRLTQGFFRSVLPAMESGYMRPRYNGYLHFQDNAGVPLQECIRGKRTVESALLEMNRIYRESLNFKKQSMIAI